MLDSLTEPDSTDVVALSLILRPQFIRRLEPVVRPVCQGCLEKVPAAAGKSLKLECGHSYCSQCVGDMFWLAIRDRTHYPPRCCSDKGIFLHDVQSILGCMARITYAERFDIYDPPLPEFRMEITVCRTCWQPIAKRTEYVIRQCLYCGEETCACCKKPASNHQYMNYCEFDQEHQSRLAGFVEIENARQAWKLELERE